MDLRIVEPRLEGPIEFEVKSATWALSYRITFGEEGPIYTACDADAEICLPMGRMGLAEFMTKNGMHVFFEQEALLEPDGDLLRPKQLRMNFDPASLEVIDWSDVDIKKESQGPNHDTDSVQHRVLKHLAGEADWEVIIDDHGTGEIADIVMLRRDNGLLTVMLAHCKSSGTDSPGARLSDLYEVCGQAKKSPKSRSEIGNVLQKLRRREARRVQRGLTGFVLGGEEEFISILENVRLLDVRVTVAIAQPGLSVAQFNIPLSKLLGGTQLQLDEIYNCDFRVFCSA